MHTMSVVFTIGKIEAFSRIGVRFISAIEEIGVGYI